MEFGGDNLLSPKKDCHPPVCLPIHAVGDGRIIDVSSPLSSVPWQIDLTFVALKSRVRSSCSRTPVILSASGQVICRPWMAQSSIVSNVMARSRQTKPGSLYRQPRLPISRHNALEVVVLTMRDRS